MGDKKGDFKVQDLGVSIAAEKNWIFVVGCGPASADCDNTQNPPRMKRLNPIDFEKMPTLPYDLQSLKDELRKKLESVEKAIAEAQRQESSLMAGQGGRAEERGPEASGRKGPGA